MEHLCEAGFEKAGKCCTRIEGLGVRLGGRRILEDISLHIHCKQLIVITGPNGGGKTTLLKSILGEVEHEGEMHFMDADRKRPDAPLIGYVPQYLDFDRRTPMCVLDLFGSVFGKKPVFWGYGESLRKKVSKVLDVVGASHLTERRLGDLSGGELQRVLLALSLVPVPNLLLLDEPVAGMDARGIELFYATVSALREQYDLAVIMVSHDLREVMRVADRMVFLDKKIVCQGTPHEVLNHEEVQKVLGWDAFKENFGEETV